MKLDFRSLMHHNENRHGGIVIKPGSSFPLIHIEGSQTYIETTSGAVRAIMWGTPEFNWGQQ